MIIYNIMIRYILFLRGINVGRTKRIKTQDITAMLCALFDDVRSFGQSGNFVFSTSFLRIAIVLKIRTNFEANFGFSVPCVLRSFDELSDAVESNPFPDAPKNRLYLILMEKDVPTRKIRWEDNGDVAVRDGMHIYLNCSGEYHKSKLSSNFFEKELNVVCTARNWNTVESILKLQ